MQTFINLVVLVVVGAALIFVFRKLRPKLHERRMRRWEQAGLLPHQVDPYAPDPSADSPRDEHGEHDAT